MTPPGAMQGDFVAALIEGMNQDLGRDVAEISVYSLNSALDTAVRASSAQYDDPDTIARLQIRLEESVGTETGALQDWCMQHCDTKGWMMGFFQAGAACRRLLSGTLLPNTAGRVIHASLSSTSPRLLAKRPVNCGRSSLKWQDPTGSGKSAVLEPE